MLAPAQFVGFFDHARGPGTHPYTLSFYATTNGGSGLFTNVANGVATSVRLISNTNGTGTPITVGTLANNPAPGTPAYQVFNGYVDFNTNTAAAIQVPANSMLIYTFSNLNPNARYTFRGTAIRGEPLYTNRWGKVSILGVETATPNHTSNALTSADAPGDIAENEVAINFGVNHLPSQGDMAAWDDIIPGPDGVFRIACTRYTGFVPRGGSSVAGSPPYGYAITGIRLEEITTPPDPIMIEQGPTPASLIIDQGQTAIFQVAVSGTAPRYQWFREDGQPIRHALATNTPNLTLTNADPGDTGIYRLRITNNISAALSDPAQLTVNPDITPPDLLSGTGFLNASQFLLHFSEALDQARTLSAGRFHIRLSSGGGSLSIAAIAFTNTTDVLITTSNPRQQGANYSADVEPNAVFDKVGNGSSQDSINLALEVALLTLTNSPWRYNADGFDLGIDFIDPLFDDSSWAEGSSIFDGKSPQPRTTIANLPVSTQLPLTNSSYPSLSAVIPTYYFRTHFTLPTSPERVLGLRLRTLIDDFDDLYINGLEVYRNPGYPAGNPPPSFGYSGGNAVGTATVLGPYEINHSSLRAGENVAAAILNQVSAASSDATFAYELIVTIEGFGASGPSLTIVRDSSSGSITVTWPVGSGAQLYESDSPGSGAATWSLVAGASDGSYTIPAGNGVSGKFYTLRR